jgi:hypothetical protein
MLTALYHMLKDGTCRKDLGANHVDRRCTEIKARRPAAKIAKPGFDVELRPPRLIAPAESPFQSTISVGAASPAGPNGTPDLACRRAHRGAPFFGGQPRGHCRNMPTPRERQHV